MPQPTVRTTLGQSVIGGLVGSTKRQRFNSTINLRMSPTFATDRAFGSKVATSHELLSETTTGAISGNTINVYDLFLLTSAALGAPEVIDLGRVDTDGGALKRYIFRKKSFEPDTPLPLELHRGNVEHGERVNNAVVTDLSVSVSKNGGTSTISGAILGTLLDVGVPLTVANPAVTITLATTPGRTETIDVTYDGELIGTYTEALDAATLQADLRTFVDPDITVTGGPLTNAALVVTFPEGTTLAAFDAVATDDLADPLTVPDLNFVVTSTGEQIDLVPNVSVTAPGLAAYIGTARPSFDDPSAAADGTFSRGSFDWGLTGLYQAWNEQDGSGPGPSAFNPGESGGSTGLWIGAGPRGAALVADYRASRRLYVTGYHAMASGWAVGFYTCGKVSAVEDFGDQNGSFGHGVTFEPMHDNEWGAGQVLVIDAAFDAALLPA